MPERTAEEAAPYRVEWRDGLALVRLTSGKANALNPRSLAAIERALDEAAGGGARGVVLTGYERFFSAGLDLVTLYGLERDAMDVFMAWFDAVMLRVFAFPQPVVAALGGHAVAGGAVLALACDARVMGAGAGRFGLNEIRLGVPFPASALEIVRYAVPARSVEAALYDGELVDPRAALERGLVTEVVDGDVVEAALQVCARLAAAPAAAFESIKAALKGPAVERARAMLAPLRRAFVDAWYAPEARRRIGEARARLRVDPSEVECRPTSRAEGRSIRWRETRMDIEAVTESIWAHTMRRSYFPAEWKGRLTVEQAYRVQLGLLDRWVARGERLTGWKVGLTAPVIQRQFGMHEPVMGFLLESGHRDTGVLFQHGELIQPGFENELCLTVGVPLQGPGVTPAQARAAIMAVQPAFEIIEGRGDFRADVSLGITDDEQQKAFVTGPSMPLPPGWEPAQITVEVLINGRLIDHADGSAETGHPVGAVAWLANKLAEFDRRIEAGHRIMSGSFTKQYPIARGDRIETRFTPFGTVRASFD